MAAIPFRLPRDDEHTSIVGRNGSGKSQLGVFVLSRQNLKEKPWYILDYKGEELIGAVERIREIDFSEVPTKPGLYVLHSRPDLIDETEKWLWKVWETEGGGLFVDEGYMVPDMGAYQGILTQGRSKRIPTINLTQRPVGVTRFVFSEASHVVVFDLNDERDEKTVQGFTPKGFMNWLPNGFDAAVDQFDKKKRLLPKYHARWWNGKDRQAYLMRPVPEAEELITAINVQLEPKLRWL